MGLLDSFEAENNAAADDMLRRPAPNLVQPTKFNAWKTTTAAPRGVAAGANESTGFMADVIGAFGQVLGATDARPGMFGSQTEEQRKQEQAARTKMLEQGLDFDAGDQFRSAAKMFMPDAETAHTSENIMFGLGRFATKAVGYSVAAGPTVGAGLVGLDEGLTAADDLKQQGVDLATRTKVGAVAGVAGAAGVLLPVAGKGVAQTVGLVAAGGPGAFVAQQAATRQILEDADYAKLADQYDPFDPVGLAVATLVPAGFGAMAMRGAKIRAKAADVKPPEGVPLPEQAPVLPERAKPTPEQVDAARVDMLTQHMENSGLYKADDAKAAALHVAAYAKAMEDISAGRRVDVTELVPSDKLEVSRALDTFSQGLEAARTDLLAQAAKRADPGAVRQMQAELVDAQARLAEVEDPIAIKARATELQQSERVSFKQAMAQAKKEFGAQAADIRARVDRLESALLDNAQGQQAFDAINRIDQQAQKVGQQRAAIDAPATKETPTAMAAREAAASTSQQAKMDGAPNVQDAQQARSGTSSSDAQQPGQSTQPARQSAGGVAQAGAGEQGAGFSGSGGGAAEAGLVAQRLTEIQQQFPDLTVQMDGMDKPMPLSEFLAQVQRDAMDGTDFELGGNDAPLMQLAASCFLLNG